MRCFLLDYSAEMARTVSEEKVNLWNKASWITYDRAIYYSINDGSVDHIEVFQ